MPIQFTHYNLGPLKPGRVIEVTLTGSAANVQLLNQVNYDRFRTGQEYRHLGGLVSKSPIHLKVPFEDKWHVTIDLRGLTGTVESTVRVLPEALSDFE